MSSLDITKNKIFECLDCGQQWAEDKVPKVNRCHWCMSTKVELVCDMTSQMHLLHHDEAQC